MPCTTPTHKTHPLTALLAGPQARMLPAMCVTKELGGVIQLPGLKPLIEDTELASLVFSYSTSFFSASSAVATAFLAVTSGCR